MQPKDTLKVSRSWEQPAQYRIKWRATVHKHIMACEARWHEFAAEMHRRRSEHTAQQEGTTVTLPSVDCAADNVPPR